jgi:hypothetical protein
MKLKKSLAALKVVKPVNAVKIGERTEPVETTSRAAVVGNFKTNMQALGKAIDAIDLSYDNVTDAKMQNFFPDAVKFRDLYNAALEKISKDSTKEVDVLAREIDNAVGSLMCETEVYSQAEGFVWALKIAGFSREKIIGATMMFIISLNQENIFEASDQASSSTPGGAGRLAV